MKRTLKRHMRLRRHATGEGRTSSRYPLVLEVRYTASGRFALQKTGTGQTIDMSSSGLRFAADAPLATGQAIEVLVSWPALLDGDIGLQLALSGFIVRTNGTEVALRIHHYHFSTRALG